MGSRLEVNSGGLSLGVLVVNVSLSGSNLAHAGSSGTWALARSSTGKRASDWTFLLVGSFSRAVTTGMSKRCLGSSIGNQSLGTHHVQVSRWTIERCSSSSLLASIGAEPRRPVSSLSHPTISSRGATRGNRPNCTRSLDSYLEPRNPGTKLPLIRASLRGTGLPIVYLGRGYLASRLIRSTNIHDSGNDL